MEQATANLVLGILAALTPIVVALVGWLAKKGVDYLDKKTKYLDAAHQAARKERLKQGLVDAAQAAVRAVEQTFVKEAKARSTDGKLTRKEAQEAFKLALRSTLSILGDEGKEIGKDLLDATIESVVGQVSGEQAAKKALEGKAAA